MTLKIRTWKECKKNFSVDYISIVCFIDIKKFSKISKRATVRLYRFCTWKKHQGSITPHRSNEIISSVNRILNVSHAIMITPEFAYHLFNTCWFKYNDTGRFCIVSFESRSMFRLLIYIRSPYRCVKKLAKKHFSNIPQMTFSKMLKIWFSLIPWGVIHLLGFFSNRTWLF